MRACVLSHFSHVPFFVTPWTVARQAPLPMGILQARILEWVAILQEIFLAQGLNPGLLHWRQNLHHWQHLGSPMYILCTHCIFVS